MARHVMFGFTSTLGLSVTVSGFSLMFAAASHLAAVPPSPPPTYDPLEGPYVVWVETDGTFDASHAPRIVEGWSHRRDERLGAFLLCLRSKGLPWRLERKALAGTATALSKAGATTVLIGTPSVCNSLPVVALPSDLATRSRIEVRGLLYP